MWMYLLNLKELYLEAPPDKFNDGFLNLKNLQTLSLRSNSWNSNFRHIVNDTFEGLRWSPIEKLDLGKCYIEVFEGHPFQYLPALNWLSLTYNGVRDFLSGDRRSSLVSLQHLDLNWTMLYSSMYLPFETCNFGPTLTSLTFSNNSIDKLGAISRCVPNLECFPVLITTFLCTYKLSCIC